MRCVIPGRSVKLFAKAIHCLSKIGNELYLEALSEGLALRTVSSSRSAYACFLFNESFFISYDDGSDESAGDSEEEDLLRCKIAMKSCLSAFKSMNTIEKTVDQCKIDLNVREARLVFLFYCRHGITKTYNLTFLECETLQAVFAKDLCPNFMTTQAKILNDAVVNFPNNQEEITLVVSPETLKVKNYVDDEPEPNRVIHTEMMLAPEEFDNYQIGVDTEVTFCLKELRAILTFAEFSSQPINMHFETSGRPIVFSMDGDSTYEADFVLATLIDHQSSTQSSQASVTAAPSTSAKKVPKDRNVKCSAKTDPTTNPDQVKQKVGASSHIKTAQNSQTNNHYNDVEQNDSLFNEENNDGDMDMTEVDKVLLKEKTPRPSQNSEGKTYNKKSQSNSGNTAEETSQRGKDANKSVLDEFFSDSFPYQDVFTARKKDLSVIPEASQESANTSVRGSAQPIQTPPSTVTDVSFMKNLDMPSLGDSCISLDENSLNQTGPKKTKRRPVEPDNSSMDVDADEDYDFVPGTPPHKKFKSMFFAASKQQGVSQDEVLAADSDED